MREFLDTLPLRLAAVVAALVGAVCLATGVNLWVAAQRIAAAFVALLLAGLFVRNVITAIHGATAARGAGAGAHGRDAGVPSPDAPPPETGGNVDVVAPEAPVGDLLRDDERQGQ